MFEWESDAPVDLGSTRLQHTHMQDEYNVYNLSYNIKVCQIGVWCSRYLQKGHRLKTQLIHVFRLPNFPQMLTRPFGLQTRMRENLFVTVVAYELRYVWAAVRMRDS
jgi:hypothetical protein